MIKDNYKKYVTDDETLVKYNEYQKKYRTNIRDSDKKIIDIISNLSKLDKNPSILDIGCSTGNLLYHIQNKFPSATLFGGDLSQTSIEICKRDEDLKKISFSTKDMLNINESDKYDLIIVNAVTYLFSWEEYDKAIQSIFAALKKGGYLIDFEWLHPFDVQDLTIYETNEWNPNGMKMHIRPYKKVSEYLKKAGFSSINFEAFEISKELPCLGFDKDTTSYTKKDLEGKNMLFRGILYQPWCHMIAQK